MNAIEFIKDVNDNYNASPIYEECFNAINAFRMVASDRHALESIVADVIESGNGINEVTWELLMVVAVAWNKATHGKAFRTMEIMNRLGVQTFTIYCDIWKVTFVTTCHHIIEYDPDWFNRVELYDDETLAHNFHVEGSKSLGESNFLD